jgi:hypothetical protein
MRAAGFVVEVLVTTRHKFVQDWIRDLPAQDLREHFLFIGCGGDGLVHEMLNGFRTRPDSGDDNVGLRCTSFLGGSASSMASLLAINWGLDKLSNINVAYAITRQKFINAQTAIYQTNGSFPEIYSFHTYSSGFIADAVSNSRWLRCIGETRYTVGMITEIIKKSSKLCEIWFSESLVDLPPINEQFDGNDYPGIEWNHFRGNLHTIILQNFEHLTNDFTVSCRVKLGECTGDSIYLKEGCGRWGLFSFLRGMMNGDLQKRDLGPMVEWKTFRLE